MTGHSEGRETTQEKRSLGTTSIGEIYSLRGSHELRLPGLLGVLGCVLKGGKKDPNFRK